MTIDKRSTDWVPDSCTLPAYAQPMRVAEFDQFLADSVHRTARPHRTRLDLLIDAAAVPRGRDLADRETACCSFFTFTFEPAGAGTVMHIDVPAGRAEVLDALAIRVGAVTR